MADPFIGRPFAMPMMKPFIPKKLQPWIYLSFTIIFQMVNCVYMGSMEQMIGELGFMHEDVMMIAMCGILGVAMPFPILFRLKFRFTNRSLLLFSISGMMICNLMALWVRSIPVLCMLSYACDFMKLMATFECFSNIQLWMTPKRDFQIFFPLLYIVIIGDMSWSSWVATQLTYYCGSWMAMQWLVILLLGIVLLFIYFCTQHFRFMKPIPFISIDWLGCLLWSLLILEGIFIFNYGEYYNWWDGKVWRTVLISIPVTAWFAIQRMRHIRHPYISPDAFKYKTLIPILGMFAVAELMNSTPKALQTVFTGAILHYGTMTTSIFDLINIAGAMTGCLFCLWWMKMLHQKYTTLLTIGFLFLLIYQVWMYFYITPALNIERLYFPTFIQNFGYAIFFVTLTIYLQELMPFQHFFMGLTIAGFIRNGFVATICSGVYSYMLRYYVADNMVSGRPYDYMQSMMMGIKQLYGVTCIGGMFFLLLLMLWHVQPIRSTLKHIPYWNVIGRDMKKELQHEE
jgi:hypothetical protein